MEAYEVLLFFIIKSISKGQIEWEKKRLQWREKDEKRHRLQYKEECEDRERLWHLQELRKEEIKRVIKIYYTILIL